MTILMQLFWGFNWKGKSKLRNSEKHNFTVRVYTMRCNIIENIHEVIGPRDRVVLSRETKEILKKVLLFVQSLNQVKILIFIPLVFSFFIFPACTSDFFSFLLRFRIWEIKKCIEHRVTIPQGQRHVSSAQQS